MRRLGDLIDQNVPEIAAMETADTGLPIHQTKNVLIPRASHNFEFFAEVCQQMNGKTYPVDDKMLNYTLVQPVGVCALVSPWNVPFMTATWKVAPCLALGNTAVLKMSELSPLTADRLGELALEAGIPAGVLNVVQGYGATAGDALVRHHDVRAVSFTGGTATGRNIMKNAGLKKYSMELGGKSPVLIFEDADIERALDAALFTIFSINGERCTAGSRIFIQQSIYPEFVKRFAERANRLRVGDPTDPNTQVGALISQQHWEKVSGYIRLGIEEGATLLAGGADKPSNLPAHLKAATSCARRCWRMSTTVCASPRKRFLARSPACCRSKTKRKGCAWRTMWNTAWRRISGPRTSAKCCVWRAVLKPGWCSSTPRTCATCVSRSAA